MTANVNRTEVKPSHHSSLVASAMSGILPHIKGNLIQEGNKTFLERKPLTFLGKPIMGQNLPEEFILE